SLGSTNSTLLNGKSLVAVEDDITLAEGSALTLGELTLRFTREPVPEPDLRRKGKRRPTREDTQVGVKTVYLDSADAWHQPAPQPSAATSSKPRSTPPPPPPPRASVKPPPPPPRTGGTPRVVTAGSAEPAPVELAALERSYKESRAALVVAVRRKLAELPDDVSRKRLLSSLARREPALVADPELRLDLQRAGVVAAPEIPELREWLRAISNDIIPDDTIFDSQQTLTRVLGLVEALIQSLAEIHDAQDSVRRRWLGARPRRSLLQSDKGHLVLAYLLNPQADWNARLQELEQSVRDVVTHELALFRATLEGARTLVQAISPEVVAQTEAAADGDSQADDQRPGGFWERLLRRHARDIRLWQQFINLYDELTDGARYERVFFGRVFSRSYLAAMGQTEPSAPT
ncbi:MAG: type VI secretion system-associated FHA domain protein, partial [Polyangiales bacterium]